MESQKNITHMKTCLNIPYSMLQIYIYIHTYSHIHINNFCRLDLHVSQHSMSPFLVVISPFGGLESPLLEFPVGSIMIVRPIFPWGGSSSIFAFRNQNLSTSDSHYFAWIILQNVESRNASRSLVEVCRLGRTPFYFYRVVYRVFTCFLQTTRGLNLHCRPSGAPQRWSRTGSECLTKDIEVWAPKTVVTTQRKIKQIKLLRTDENDSWL
jgi:hypothetical protein